MTPFGLVPLDAIDTPDRLRPLDQAHVEATAASMAERGLIKPIVLRRAPEANRAILVAGAHRLAAARRLGWEEIGAITLDLTADEARLIEIDENLIRRELSALDRAIFLAERKRVYLALHPETGRGKAKKSKDGKSANLADFASFGADAAEKVGLSERAINRAIEWVSKLSAETIAAVRASGIADNQSQLIALAELPADQQKKTAKALADGAPNVERARVAAGLIPDLKADAKKALLASFEAMLARLAERNLLEKARTMLDAAIERAARAKTEGEKQAAKSKAKKQQRAKQKRARA